MPHQRAPYAQAQRQHQEAMIPPPAELDGPVGQLIQGAANGILHVQRSSTTGRSL
jgi:hypothetical protein